ncbi:MAG: PqqD family peptide modification chaperone [Candidatus Omnitrophica bacterium]|nr:PqqD family peptide modification chaperone [Candidatus Omnitrophota bacterium]
MSLNKNLKANSKIVFREETDDALLFDPDSGNIKVINETGKFIWANLDGKNDEDSLVKKIMDKFDISDEQKAREDLGKFLEDLKIQKFLE